MRFAALGDELKQLEERLGGIEGAMTDEDFAFAERVVAQMTSLAWGEKAAVPNLATLASNRAEAEKESERARSTALVSALVIGKTPLAEALSMQSYLDENRRDAVFEVEKTDEVTVAADLAKAMAPDVIVVDGDLAGAAELVEALITDPMTESIPVIVAGQFGKPEDAARFAALGVARSLPKPISPGQIRRACSEVISSYVKHEIVREPIGAVTVDQLGARLAEELRRGLSAVDARFRDTNVELGEGTEVLAALWGAVARIRDVVTIQSKGGLRFQTGGPEGAMPLAPWLGANEPRAEGVRQRSRQAARAVPAVSLQKARIVVADDDPAVVWFLAGVLKAAGATVYEARDGERAFEVAKHCEPDLVITDVLMPKLDGFALSRALKRDVVLRDVPVVLLSWKEDLLQRVRELGADADGYLRKEASASAVVQRVRELLHARLRVAERIAAGGEVRGRLDGLTTTTLLRMVCSMRENATISVRDASYLYEVEVRGGRPIRATRTSVAGSLERGPSVVGSLLGAGDGRFVIAPPREDEEVATVRAELSGTLGEQLARRSSRARVRRRKASRGIEPRPDPAGSGRRRAPRGIPRRDARTGAQAPQGRRRRRVSTIDRHERTSPTASSRGRARRRCRARRDHRGFRSRRRRSVAGRHAVRARASSRRSRSEPGLSGSAAGVACGAHRRPPTRWRCRCRLRRTC